MTRKWKIALGVLAFMVIFCLWYTRPRSFEDLVGDGEFQNFIIKTHAVEANATERIKEEWQFDSRGEFEAELREILQSCKYRVRLRSLLPFTNPEPIYGDGSVTVFLLAVTGTEENFSSTYRGTAATFRVNGRTILTQVQDPDILQKILAFVQEHGWITYSKKES